MVLLSQRFVDFGCKTAKQRFTPKTKHFIALFPVLVETSWCWIGLSSISYCDRIAAYLQLSPSRARRRASLPRSRMAQPTAVGLPMSLSRLVQLKNANRFAGSPACYSSSLPSHLASRSPIHLHPLPPRWIHYTRHRITGSRPSSEESE